MRKTSVIAALAILLSLPISAWATLGQNVQSINIDASNLNAEVRSTDRGAYQIYELTAANADGGGGYVREYLDPNNDVVFGVSWSGITYQATELILGAYLNQAKALAGTDQNRFDYDMGGSEDNYNGYFVLIPATPYGLNTAVVR